MLNVGVIGCGNCGNQIAQLAKKEADTDVFCINTSENDLSTIPEGIPKKCIGDAEGSGKDRTQAREFLKHSIAEITSDEDFKTFLAGKDVILVASSTGGGSGSGMSLVLTKIILQACLNPDGTQKIVIPLGVIPRLDEGKSTQANTMEYIYELYNVLQKPTYMLYDNNTYAKESAHIVLERVNKDIVQAIKVMQCRFNNTTPYDSIDEKDMKQLLRTPGLISITSLMGIKEKDLDNETIEDLLITEMKNSSCVEFQRDGKVSRTGLITNLSVKLNDIFDSHIQKVRKFVGEPIEEFLHIAVNEDKSMSNNVFLILTGLSKIVDRVDKIKERIEEIDAVQAAETEDVEITRDELDRLNAERNDREKVTSDETGTNLKDIFAAFE